MTNSNRSTAQQWLRRAGVAGLRIPDALAQRLVPSVPNRVCYASEPDYADSALAVFRHALRTRRDIEHVWFLRDMRVAERIRREFESTGAAGHRLIIKPWGIRSYPTYLRSRFAFHTHGMYSFSPPRGPRRSVSMWHGMPVKAVRRLHAGNKVLFDVHGTYQVTTSSFFRYTVAAAFGVHPSTVLLTGLPRTDVLKGHAEPGMGRTTIAERLGIDAARPWLLWTPTHRSEPDFRGTSPPKTFLEAIDPSLLDALDAACDEHGVDAIVKIHPYDRLNTADEIDFPYEHLTLATPAMWKERELDIYDVAAESAGLITDVSSTLVDFLYTRRPIGMLGFDPATYSRETTFDLELLLTCDAVRRLDTPVEVRSFVQHVASEEKVPADQDGTRFFIEDSDISSAEAVLRAVGL